MYSILSWQLSERVFKQLRSVSRQVRIDRQHERYMTTIIDINYVQEGHKEICVRMYPVGKTWDSKRHRKLVICGTCGAVLKRWLLHGKIETSIEFTQSNSNCHNRYLGLYETYYNGKQYGIRYHIYHEYSILAYFPYMTDSQTLYRRLFKIS